MGEEGFFADSSLLYHRNIPSAIASASVWKLNDQNTTPNHPLEPRHLKLHTLFPTGQEFDAVTGRRLILGNTDLRLSYVVASTASPLYRNAIGDEVVYLENGEATLDTVFGTLDTHQETTSTSRRRQHIVGSPGQQPVPGICNRGEQSRHPAPKRYLSRFGQLLESAPYCERDLHGRPPL